MFEVVEIRKDGDAYTHTVLAIGELDEVNAYVWKRLEGSHSPDVDSIEVLRNGHHVSTYRPGPKRKRGGPLTAAW